MGQLHAGDLPDALPTPQPNMSEADFKQMVETCKEYIRAGDAFQGPREFARLDRYRLDQHVLAIDRGLFQDVAVVLDNAALAVRAAVVFDVGGRVRRNGEHAVLNGARHHLRAIARQFVLALHARFVADVIDDARTRHRG